MNRDLFYDFKLKLFDWLDEALKNGSPDNAVALCFNIYECENCKEKDDLSHFSFKDSGFKCMLCAKQDKGAIEISATTKDAIRYIIMADAKKIYSFNIPQESINELKIISNIYLNENICKGELL